MSRPRAPGGSLDGVVPYWKASVRSLSALRVIRMRALQGPYSDDELVEALTRAHRDGVNGTSIARRSVALWKLERIAFSYCRRGGCLEGARIPAEILPIAHTGLGIAAVEEAGLAGDRIRESVRRQAHPDYADFAYESVGCAWGVCESNAFRRLFENFTGVRFKRTARPNHAEFLAEFPTDSHSFLANGYGRTLYFAHRRIERSVQAAAKLGALDLEAIVQGVAFAYAMINARDLRQILDARISLQTPTLADAFERGLVAALAMWTWTFPGFTESLAPQSSRQAALMGQAERIVADSRRAGRFLVSALG